MQPLSIIEYLDELEHLRTGFIPRVVIAIMDRFVLERAEEALHHGIVVTVPFPAHAGREPLLSEHLLVRSAGVLRSLVCVVNQFQRALGLENTEFLERLDQFLSQLPKNWEYAVEVRHESLLTPEYRDILQRHGVSHVYNHWTSMPALLEQHKLLGEVFTAPFVILRLLTPRGVKHDDAVRRYKPYNQLKMPLPQMREETVTLAEQAVSNRRRVYALVNNRSEGSAPRTVQAIVDMLAGRRAR
jgi:uncharacterized protein YecE (DUF72 family)